jgi:hypothetical protein
MVNLFYNYYISKYAERNNELYFCFNALFNNNLIDKIYIITDVKNAETRDRGIIIPFQSQPRFRDIMWFINYFTGSDDINIFINSDCYINRSSIQIVKDSIKKGEVYCLTRWNITSLCPFKSIYYGNTYSQDCWINVGSYPEIEGGDYVMGRPGCDNSFAYELKNAGLKLKNPSLQVKVFHYHLSEIRDKFPVTIYGDADLYKKIRVNKPFISVNISNI